MKYLWWAVQGVISLAMVLLIMFHGTVTLDLPEFQMTLALRWVVLILAIVWCCVGYRWGYERKRDLVRKELGKARKRPSLKVLWADPQTGSEVDRMFEQLEA